MKKFAKFLTAVLAAAFLALAAVLVGCSAPSVVSIEKTGTRAEGDVYTVTYSDGSTSELIIEGGKDGQDVTASDLYQTYLAETGENISYAEFLEKYLTFESGDNSAAIGETLLSGVKVFSEFVEESRSGFLRYEDTAVYTGGGVIYSMDEENTYILTNYHVVYDSKASGGNANANGAKIARKLVCYLYGSEYDPDRVVGQYDEDGYTVVDYGNNYIECDYAGGSVNADIAVLRADTDDVLAVNGQAQAVAVADGYAVGDAAYTIGNPEGEGISVTQGIVSVADEYISLNIDGTAREYRSIRIDTPLYSGNSGGGLFNTAGELIGIANAGNKQEENINFAIPLPIVTGAADNIIYFYEDGDPSTSGAYKIDFADEDSLFAENSRYVYDKAAGEGEIVEDVVLGSDAGMVSEFGLAAGDTVRAFLVGRGGETVEYGVDRTFDVSDILYVLRPGDTLSVRYESGGRTLTSAAVSLSASDFVCAA